jgi:integrase
MRKINIENERRKRKYFEWLRNAKGLSPTTIKGVEKAIWEWEDFTKTADFRQFNENTAIAFKQDLLQRKNNRSGKTLALSTCLHYLNALSEFFLWLSGQPGYKSKITPDKVAYLKLDRKQSKIASESAVVEYPSLEQVKAVATSITVENEVDLRDRALISFALLSGMRVEAIMSLPIQCIDLEEMEILQDPKQGVRTKFSKRNKSTLFNFDLTLISYIKEWAEFLVEKKLFSPQDPFFPSTKIEQKSENDLVFIAEKVHPQPWKNTNSIREIFKKRFHHAGIKYFSPHSFRHLAIRLAFGRCTTAEELKAVSQNFGHENIGTTMLTYGTIREDEVKGIIKKMDFSGETKANQEEIEQAIATLQKLKKGG